MAMDLPLIGTVDMGVVTDMPIHGLGVPDGAPAMAGLQIGKPTAEMLTVSR